ANLRRALAAQRGDVTCIVIAQRVSSIRGADQILVLDDGRAIGLGTHNALMQSCPAYRDIALTQMAELAQGEAPGTEARR
ncbi:MAG TPA: hypothetical protein VLA21_03670, partial [Candidatus Limnocylindria bacterium]|nr:hypothetical protein [Candidatus Limnocylindria bacterium]